MAQSVKCPTLARVMISRLMGLSPLSGSVVTAQSLEPASYSVSPPLLRLSPLFTLCEFEPCLGLCGDSSEPGAYFGFCVSLSLCPSPTRALSLSLKK